MQVARGLDALDGELVERVQAGTYEYDVTEDTFDVRGWLQDNEPALAGEPQETR